MAEHGGGGHSESHASSSGGGKGGGGFIEKVLEAFGGAIIETIEGTAATPLADLGLKAVEGTGEVVQAATNLGAQPAAKGGGGGGGHSH